MILSKHVAEEMGARMITTGYIERVLARPELVVIDPVDPSLTRSYGRIDEFGGRTLRVVHRPDGNDIFVVTAHWDRGMKL